MRLAYVQWHWAVLQTFRAWGRVVAQTPLREPVIAVDNDRLVLRHVDGRFWAAANCPFCAASIACVDLADHEQRCARPRASTVRVVPTDSGGAAVPASVPSAAAGVGRMVATAPPRRRDELLNRSSARVFRQGPVLTGGLLMTAFAALAAALVIGAILASEFPSQALEWLSGLTLSP